MGSNPIVSATCLREQFLFVPPRTELLVVFEGYVERAVNRPEYQQS